MELLIRITISFSVTTMLILLLKLLFQNKLTPKWHVLIWSILIIRLAIPILPESDISIFNFVPDASGIFKDFREVEVVNNYTKEDNTQNKVDWKNYGAVDTNTERNLTLSTEQRSRVNDFEQSYSFDSIKNIPRIILSIYWIIFLLLIAILFSSYNRFMRKISKLPFCCDSHTLNLFSVCKENMGIKKRDIALKCGAESPMMAGIINPTIYISDGYNDEELKHVLNHELCHYKNRDTVWNILSTLILCMNWFNPIAWFAYITFRRDLEMYCDYRAIELIGDKRGYAEVLLKTASSQSCFKFATTYLESSQKEVSKRIKRIAYFKKPKVWVSILGIFLVAVISVFCLTNAVDISNKTQIIGVNGPDHEWDTYMITVPLSWGEEYEEVIHSDSPDCESIIFHDKDGYEIAGLTYKLIDLTDSEMNLKNQEKEKLIKDTINYKDKIIELIKNSQGISNKERLGKNIQIERLKNVSEHIWDAYKVNYLKSSKVLRTEIYLITNEQTSTIPVLYKQTDDITEDELIQVAKTLEEVKEPSYYKPKAEAELLADGKTGVGVIGGKYDARTLMENYFKNYVDIKMPLSRDICGYKINSFQEIKPKGDIPNIIDEGMVEGENAPWNIIYPTAKVYKVDYELIPENKAKYRDIAGGGFEITEEGNKHYNQRYGVFYGYCEDGVNYEAVFLGFIPECNLAEWGIDYSVLNLIDYWYEHEVLDRVYENAKVKYVGDASAVGKLINLLPLHEYGNGIELQTENEPFEVTVNYKIGRGEAYDSEKGGLLSSWPKADGDLTGIYSQAAPKKMNFYIEKQLVKNATWLEQGIINAQVAHIKCESPYLEDVFFYDYHHPNNEKI